MIPPNHKGQRVTRINALAFANLIKCLNEGLYSCYELADVTGLHYATVLEYTRAMYRAGAIHITGWDLDARGRVALKVYKMGAGKDAKKHTIPATERSKAYRKKIKQLDAIRRLSGVTS